MTNTNTKKSAKKAATINPVFEAAIFDMVKGSEFEKLFTPATTKAA